MTSQRVGLIIVAAGSSRRMRGVDKVWTELNGRPVIWYSVSALVAEVDEAIVVVREEDVERAHERLCPEFPKLTIVAGGEERQESVACGLKALNPSTIVAVHDAARPLAMSDLIRDGARLLDVFDGAVPVEPLRDTIKQVNGEGWVTATLDRTQLRAAQTPQVFWRQVLERAHRRAQSGGGLFTDDASMVEAAGYRVGVLAGAPNNFKITTAHDLDIARYLVSRVHST